MDDVLQVAFYFPNGCKHSWYVNDDGRCQCHAETTGTLIITCTIPLHCRVSVTSGYCVTLTQLLKGVPSHETRQIIYGLTMK